jgi:hypothetical protein
MYSSISAKTKSGFCACAITFQTQSVIEGVDGVTVGFPLVRTRFFLINWTSSDVALQIQINTQIESEDCVWIRCNQLVSRNKFHLPHRTIQGKWGTNGYRLQYIYIYTLQVKAVPLQAWSGPEGSRKLRFPDFTTTAQDGGKVVSRTHWPPPLPPGSTPGTHFC